MTNTRRDFVMTAVATGLAGAQETAAMPRRPLGKTGLQVSVIGLGGARIGHLEDHHKAADVVRRCYDEGINYFDTAAAYAYGLSQSHFGAALKGLRDKVVLATKTRNRTATQSQVDLDQSLSGMKTDYIDLYQVHNLMNDEDVDFMFGPRGVMEMIEKARKAGKIRFVGITGHTDPKIMNRAMTQYEFATVLMPLSITDGANKAKSFEKETLPVARQKGTGIIAMKTLGAGRILSAKTATLEESIRYVLSLPVATMIMGCDQVEQVAANARIARSAKALSAAEMDRLRRQAAEQELAALEPWKRLPALQPERYVAD